MSLVRVDSVVLEGLKSNSTSQLHGWQVQFARFKLGFRYYEFLRGWPEIVLQTQFLELARRERGVERLRIHSIHWVSIHLREDRRVISILLDWGLEHGGSEWWIAQILSLCGLHQSGAVTVLRSCTYVDIRIYVCLLHKWVCLLWEALKVLWGL